MKKIFLLSTWMLWCGLCYSQTRPNIVLILLDDSRFDSYTPNGGPSFFSDPNITRIASEGINFPNTYVTYSLCVPSRASILTGLYPHTNGARNNGDVPNPDLPELQQILHDNGYRTGFIGKYDWATDPQPGWDYWFASIGEDYTRGQFNYMGTTKFFFGHKTDIISDSAVGFIANTPSDTPFFLMVSHLAPHTPFQPRLKDAELYNDDSMPFPSNFYFFDNDYPSFLFDSHFLVLDSMNLDSTLRGYYQMLAGVEESVQRILDKLTTKNYLNNTMVIFTSDNGHLWGEHQLMVKRLAYEESSKVPLFIRFPAWFPTTGSVNNEFALNIDLAPTILDAAGINTDAFHFDGMSLRKLFNGTAHRSSLYYEVLSNETVPAMRQVRDINYAYSYYFCDGLLEEFFDLNKDPHENQNQILNSNYQGLIQQYRNKLDSFKIVVNDTIVEDIKTCYLADTLYLGNNLVRHGSAFTTNYYTSSNILNAHLHAPLPTDVSLSLINILGQTVYFNHTIHVADDKYLSIDLGNLAGGTYLAVVRGNNILDSKKIILER